MLMECPCIMFGACGSDEVLLFTVCSVGKFHVLIENDI